MKWYKGIYKFGKPPRQMIEFVKSGSEAEARVSLSSLQLGYGKLTVTEIADGDAPFQSFTAEVHTKDAEEPQIFHLLALNAEMAYKKAEEKVERGNLEKINIL